MKLTGYCLLSSLSGCAWAGLAFVLGYWAMGQIIWGGLVASPAIGLMMGIAFLPACRAPLVARIFLALGTLLVAATLFGFASGVYDAFFRGMPRRHNAEVVTQAVLGTLYGTAAYLALLWPLSFVNHHWLCRVCKES